MARGRADPRWYATERGKRFHRRFCVKAMDSPTSALPALKPVTAADIRSRNLKPCSECHPSPPLRSVT